MSLKAIAVASLTLLVLVIVGIVCFIPWNVLLITYVPDAGDIQGRQSVKPFLQGATRVTGYYGNHDVDSIIFTYQTSISQPDQFWQELESSANGAGWSLKSHVDGVQKYDRIKRVGGIIPWHVEQVRIALLRPASKVVVAWVRGDSHHEVRSFDQAGVARWAEQVIWPKFLDLLEPDK